MLSSKGSSSLTLGQEKDSILLNSRSSGKNLGYVKMIS